MNIDHSDNGKSGLFFIKENEELLAEMTYQWAGRHTIIIDHTGVSEKLEGHGVGSQLVLRAVEFAREQHIKIKPLCPFAKRVFDKTPAYSDVLAHDTE